MNEKYSLKIESTVYSFEEGKELLEKLEVLSEQYNIEVSLTVKTLISFLQVDSE